MEPDCIGPTLMKTYQCKVQWRGVSGMLGSYFFVIKRWTSIPAILAVFGRLRVLLRDLQRHVLFQLIDNLSHRLNTHSLRSIKETPGALVF
jgi:hypothetical protein